MTTKRRPVPSILARLDAAALHAGECAAMRAAAHFDALAASETHAKRRAKHEARRDNCQSGAAAFRRETERRARATLLQEAT